MRTHGKTKLGFFPLPLKNGCLRHLAVRWRCSRCLIRGILRRTVSIGGSVVKSAHCYSVLIEQLRELTRNPFPNRRESPA